MGRLRIVAALGLTGAVTCSIACGISQYQVAADAFAKATAQGSTALAAIPSSLVDECWAMANDDYVAARLSASFSNDEGVSKMEPSVRIRYLASWEQWRVLPVRIALVLVDPVTNQSVPAYATWNGYCGDVQQSVTGLSAGVTALSSYSAALQTLAESGQTLGADVDKLEGQVQGAVAGFTAKGSSLAATTKALTGPLQDITNMFVDLAIEHELQKFAQRADAPVGKLVTALDASLDATARWVDVAANGARTNVTGLERRMLDVSITTFRINDGSVEPMFLPDSGLVPKRPEALAAFLQYAQQEDQSAQRLKTVIASARAVLRNIKSAHSSFVHASGQSGNALKEFLSDLACLMSDLQGLQSALAGKGGMADAGSAGSSSGGQCFKVDAGGAVGGDH